MMIVSGSILPNNRFIITGGPGSGKTTLIESFRNLGFAVFPERARELIGQGVPPPIWSNKADSVSFFDLILQKRITDHQKSIGNNISFYDRGIPDCLAFFQFQNRKAPSVLMEAIQIYLYNPVVFIAPPWEEIFSNDRVRRESFSDASILYELTATAYQSVGYKIIELPKSSLEYRISYILTAIGKISTGQ